MYLVRYYMRMSELSSQEDQKKPAPLGPMIAPIIIAALLVIGGIYFLVTKEIQIHSQPQNSQYNS